MLICGAFDGQLDVGVYRAAMLEGITEDVVEDHTTQGRVK